MTNRNSIISKKSGNKQIDHDDDYLNAREHLLAKVVPDEEPPATSNIKIF